MIERFEDLEVWKKSRELTNAAFTIKRANQHYSFNDQLVRACVSIMNNIAEGFDRRSNKEFVHFLYIAKGSAAEVRSMLYIANDQQHITQIEFNMLSSLCIEISKMLSGLIKSLSNKLP